MVAAAQITPEDIRPFLEAPGQIIAYHFVIGGRLLCALDGAPPMEISAGEVVLMPRNDRHTLASAPGLPAVSADELIRPGEGGGLAQIAHAVGYDSEVAFNRAFKRAFGEPPARWREQQLARS